MKNHLLEASSFFFLTAALISHSLIAANTQELDTYFARLKRGITCLLQRKPCSQQEKKAVYKAAYTLIISIGILSGGYLYTKGTFHQLFLSPEQQFIATLPSEQQQTAKDEYLLNAIEDVDLKKVKFWLTHDANPNAYFQDKYTVINSGKPIDFKGHILNTAIHKDSQHWQYQKSRFDTKKILKELIIHGANPNLESKYPRFSSSRAAKLSVIENHRCYTPYFDNNFIEAMMKMKK
jgi:hypothetical protein